MYLEWINFPLFFLDTDNWRCFSDLSWFCRLLEEVVTKYFCMPRDDPKTEMAAISEETHSQTVGDMLMRLPWINSLYIYIYIYIYLYVYIYIYIYNYIYIDRYVIVNVHMILMIIFPVREKNWNDIFWVHALLVLFS
mgnify:CR=1 FL=1